MVKRGGRGLGEGEVLAFIQVMDKDPRSARKDADVGKQEGESCAGVEDRLKTRGVAMTLKQQEGDRTIQSGKWCCYESSLQDKT